MTVLLFLLCVHACALYMCTYARVCVCLLFFLKILFSCFQTAFFTTLFCSFVLAALVPSSTHCMVLIFQQRLNFVFKSIANDFQMINRTESVIWDGDGKGQSCDISIWAQKQMPIKILQQKRANTVGIDRRSETISRWTCEKKRFLPSHTLFLLMFISSTLEIKVYWKWWSNRVFPGFWISNVRCWFKESTNETFCLTQ